MADIGDTIAPKADQMINEDLIPGPRTFTISRVVIKAGADQPADVYLEEFGPLPYRPSKSMRNVMTNGWGGESRTYAGKRLTLYRDPDVTFGRERTGGIKISHMSDLPNGKPLTLNLRVSRGVRKPFTVKPLAESQSAAAPPDPTAAQIQTLIDEYPTAEPERQDWIKAEVERLRAGAES